jgi:biotin carboxyl carrier protein
LEGQLRALLRTVRGSAVEELRLSVGGLRIALRREAGAAPVASAPAAGAGAQPAGAEPGPRRVEVPAPMVGPFHRSREPDGPALVAEGEHVEAGRALGVIETLGLATEVEAPASGHLERVLVEDGQPVEFGQVLAVIVADETSG